MEIVKLSYHNFVDCCMSTVSATYMYCGAPGILSQCFQYYFNIHDISHQSAASIFVCISMSSSGNALKVCLSRQRASKQSIRTLHGSKS